MKKILVATLAFLGIDAFAIDNGKKVLTEEQRQALKDGEFTAEFMTKLETALAEDSEIQATDTANGATTDVNADVVDSSAVGVLVNQLVKLNAQITAVNTEKATLLKDKETLAAEKLDLLSQKKGLTALVETLSADDEKTPKTTKTQGEELKMDATNSEFLFGIPQPFMAIDESRPYNRRAYAAIMRTRGQDILMPMAGSTDYTHLKADLGDFNRVKYNDKIQSFLQTLPSLNSIFPTLSGYRDQAALVNIFLNQDFSQADNTIGSQFTNMVKGGFNIQTEILQMYGVMFAHTFTDLAGLEKSWIGDILKNDDQVVKMSFIEYLLTEVAKKLHNEKQLRLINGKRVNPTANVPGESMAASNGFRQFFKNKIAEFKMKPFDMSAFGFLNGDWSDLNAVAYIQQMCSMVPQTILDSGNLKAYVSTKFMRSYTTNYKKLWALATEDSVATKFVDLYPTVEMIVVPNLAPSRLIVLTLAGNINTYENVPGAMTNFQIEQQDWAVKVWSKWEESIWAVLVGQQMPDANSFPDDYSSQLIWINNVDLNLDTFTTMQPDITVPDVSASKALVSNPANTAPRAITNITGAVATVDLIRLKCGSTTNGITIANSGNFVLSAAWNPVKGDTIDLIMRKDGKFVEVARTTASTAATVIAAGVTTPDMTGNSSFITSANVAACAITNLLNAVAGKTYTIFGGSATNSSTIANGGNFVLTANMTLGVGNWIKLQMSASDGKFYELDRG